jgi:phenylacetate-CoA ligase
MNPGNPERRWLVLRALLEEAVESNRFQRGRLLRDGALPSSWEEFQARVPWTHKSELAADQQEHPPYGSNLSKPLDRYTRFCQTSGTTARPLAVLDTEESWEWLLGNWRLGYGLAGVEPGRTAYFAFSFGPFLGFWTAFEAGVRMGLRCLPGGGLSTVARLEAMQRFGVEVLCCTPTYALHLAGVARSEGGDLSQAPLRRILVAGEPGGSLGTVRESLSEAWPQAEVIDHYGMTEVGPVAFAREGEPGRLRVLEERYVAEVLDPKTGEAVEQGGVGELVLTPLGRSAWPLFRYRTGDLVRARWGGGGLELCGGIVGRVDDMVIVRGVNLYPAAVEEVVRAFGEVEEYRVRVSSRGAMAEVDVEIEVCGGAVGGAGALEKAFERSFSLRIPVREVSAGTLPRFEMKARRWVRV